MTYKKSLVSNNWFMSFGDFLTLILCFFLVLISNSFEKSANIASDKNSEKVVYEVKDGEFSFVLNDDLKNKVKFFKLDDSLLSDKNVSDKNVSDKNLANKKLESEAFILKLENKEYINSVEKFTNLLQSLSFSKGYDFKLLNYKNFESIREFFAVKDKLKSENIDVSELKMSKNNENEIILRIYKKI